MKQQKLGLFLALVGVVCVMNGSSSCAQMGVTGENNATGTTAASNGAHLSERPASGDESTPKQNGPQAGAKNSNPSASQAAAPAKREQQPVGATQATNTVPTSPDNQERVKPQNAQNPKDPAAQTSDQTTQTDNRYAQQPQQAPNAKTFPVWIYISLIVIAVVTFFYMRRGIRGIKKA